MSSISFWELLSLDFMQRALLAAVFTGLAAPAVGTYLVQRRLSLMGETLAVSGGVPSPYSTRFDSPSKSGSAFVPQCVSSVPIESAAAPNFATRQVA